MSPEDVRLLQAAVGYGSDPAPLLPAIDPSDPALEDLPENAIDGLLVQLQGGLSGNAQQHPPQQVFVQYSPPQQQQVFAQHGVENADYQFNQDFFQRITEALAKSDHGQGQGDIPSALPHKDPVVEQANESGTIIGVQRAFEIYSCTSYPPSSAHSSESSPSPSAQAHESVPPRSQNGSSSAIGLQQQQELASIMITNRIHRQTNSNARSSCRRGSSEIDVNDPLKIAERERVREENRERKKRWREVNQDRNKDNDLRCRVSKRAAKLYGPENSMEKTAWVNEEFNKRKRKRELKEKSRGDIHGSSSIFSTSDYLPQIRTLKEILPQGGLHTTFDDLVDIVMKSPEGLIEELRKVAAEVSGKNIPLQQKEPPPQIPHQSLHQPANTSDQFHHTFSPTTPPQDSGSADHTALEGLLKGLVTEGDIPEGSDLLAVLAEDNTEEIELTSPAITTPDELNGAIDDTSVEELLAALADADADSGPVLGEIAYDSYDDTMQELNALLASDLDDNPGFEMTDNVLVTIIKECGITSMEDDNAAAAVAAAPSEAEKPSDFQITPEELEEISIEDIDELLNVLNPKSTNPPSPTVNASPTPAPSTPPTNSPDQSSKYTPEIVAAILKVIFETLKLSSSPPKRPAPFSTPPPPPAKRLREQSPHHTAVDRFRDDKHLLALQRPQYIPRGEVSTVLPTAPTPLPANKSPEDEKKIKAMGFPPLMAGIIRKAE
ncbi:hypothetical protein BDD12DRAFT_823376 [Trichophaea hybrida]|nr:hypothetical protein BDD12DRAFT_823376 [Trichophaea hybrida]